MKSKFLLSSLLALFSVTVMAQQDFLIADGSSSGTYQQFMKEITSVVGDSITFKELPSSGAIENLDKLINNEVSGAFVHSDVLFFRAQSENLDNFKTLLALFHEDVHFLALTASKRTTGGVMGYGANTVTFNKVSDLAGYKVGAAGGGYVTAQVIAAKGMVNYQVIKFDSGKDVLAALTEGKIDAAVFVGASPLPNLKDLGPQYKLLAVGDTLADKLKSVYKPTNVTYTKMNPSAVPTVSADCLFICRNYKSPKMIAQLRKFRQTFYEHLDDLKETPGNHRKWMEVDPSEHGRWTWMDLGETNEPTVKAIK